MVVVLMGSSSLVFVPNGAMLARINRAMGAQVWPLAVLPVVSPRFLQWPPGNLWCWWDLRVQYALA
eukprot:10907903-Heterocapsa_arctica.AAC.1